ncbi:Rv3654c family TadE-like protein [Nocardia sp. SSK8]|uniref:Rv3654c family TadE-like protein n=1 Tax=Nocardia sp. SSK8 TaxID=3120154 RepID=UPI003008CE27
MPPANTGQPPPDPAAPEPTPLNNDPVPGQAACSIPSAVAQASWATQARVRDVGGVRRGWLSFVLVPVRSRAVRVGVWWRGGDLGGASALACFALAGLICLTVVVGQVGAAVAARHRAQAAADLGALAAAGRLVEGADAGCAVAGEVAGRMGVGVRGCVVEQWDVMVQVRAEVSFGVFGVRTVVASARAGPVEERG